MRRLSSLTAYSLIAGLSGCSTGPDYVRPDIAIPHAYKENKGNWKVAVPQDIEDHGAWWLIFNDPVLNDLVRQAIISNQSIAIAQAQYDQALAITEKARAGFFPTLGLTLGDTKSRSQINSPINGANSSPGGASSRSGIHSTTSSSLQASWEPDLWGSVRRLAEANFAAAEASAAQVAAVRLSIQSALAQTYFQLRALDEVQELLDESVTAYEKFLKIAKNQYAAGTASRLSVLQAEAQLQASQVLAIDNGIPRAQYEHAIAVLLGRPPADFSVPKQTTRLTPPPIPLQVPSVLLERRPDIANAERLMAQANAQIGVAASAFFPVLALSGSLSGSSPNFARLLAQPFPFWSLGAAMTETIFDGGARAAAVDAADAAHQAAVAQYRQTVLTAFQDVEDNLATLTMLQGEMKAQEEVVASAQKELDFMINGYKTGTLATSNVLTALYNVYAVKKSAIAIASRRMTAAVGLIKALGGGWQGR